MAAAGSITETVRKTRSIRALVLAWTSDASGVVAEIPTAHNISGEIMRIVTAPGTPAPTALYDVTLLDADGFDVLGGLGANRSATVKEQFVPLTGDGTTTNQRVAVDGTLTLTIANAGASKQGTLTLYYR